MIGLMNVEPAPVNCWASAIRGPAASASTVTDSAAAKRGVTRYIVSFSLLEVPLQLDPEGVRVSMSQQPVGDQVILAGQAELASEILVPADAGATPVIVRRVLVGVEDVVPHEEIPVLAGVVGDLPEPTIDVRAKRAAPEVFDLRAQPPEAQPVLDAVGSLHLTDGLAAHRCRRRAGVDGAADDLV